MTDTEKTSSSDDLSSIPTNGDESKQETSQSESRTVQAKDSAVDVPVGGDVKLQDSCRIMFKKISEYLQTELSASLEDYDLLEKLNELTKQKYDEMDNVTHALISRMQNINEKYASLQPFLAMIEKMDSSVTNLEQAAYKLDTYSKELEARFKKLEKATS